LPTQRHQYASTTSWHAGRRSSPEAGASRRVDRQLEQVVIDVRDHLKQAAAASFPSIVTTAWVRSHPALSGDPADQ
jgi:hypothetical protein